MTVEQFFDFYANTPVRKRNAPIELAEDTTSLNELYFRISELEEYMRPMRIKQQQLIRIAAVYEFMEQAYKRGQDDQLENERTIQAQAGPMK